MTATHSFRCALLASVFILLPLADARSQATTDSGDFVMHANAIGSLELTPDVARASAVTRSASRGLLNVAVRKKLADGGDQAVRAAVSADAINFSGQRQVLSLREVREGDAIYYLAEPRISEGEDLTFEVSARPEGSTEVLQAKFKKSFFAPLPR